MRRLTLQVDLRVYVNLNLDVAHAPWRNELEREAARRSVHVEWLHTDLLAAAMAPSLPNNTPSPQEPFKGTHRATHGGRVRSRGAPPAAPRRGRGRLRARRHPSLSTMSVSRSFNLSTSCAVRLPPREGPILSALAAAAHPCRPLRDARARARLEGGGTTNHPSACAAEAAPSPEAGAPPRGGLWRQGACRGGRARRAAGAWPGAALEGAQARPEARGRLTSFRCCRGALGRRQGAQRRAGARGERRGCAQARRRALGGAERGQPRDGAAPLRQALTGRRKAAEGAGAGQRQRARGRQGRGFLHWGRHGDSYDVVCLEHVRGLAQEAA